MPATIPPTITATFVAMFRMPFARESSFASTSSAIMPYFTGPKNELTVAKATSAAIAPYAEPRANPIAHIAHTASDSVLRMIVMRDFE